MRDLVLLWVLLIGVGFGTLGGSVVLAVRRRYKEAAWLNMIGPALVLGDSLYRMLHDHSAREFLPLWDIGVLFALSLVASFLSMRMPWARAVLLWIGWTLNCIPVGFLVLGAIFGTIMYLMFVPH